MNKLFSAALAAAFLWLDSSFGQTVINSVPYTISAPGIYTVGSNLRYSSSTGGAIVILNHNVILDLGGHYIFNAVGSNSSIGVYVQNAENVTIQNGTIAGFNYGVYFNYLGGTKLNSGDIVRYLRLTDNLDGISMVGPTLSNVTIIRLLTPVGWEALESISLAAATWPLGISRTAFPQYCRPSERCLIKNTISNCNNRFVYAG